MTHETETRITERPVRLPPPPRPFAELPEDEKRVVALLQSFRQVYTTGELTEYAVRKTSEITGLPARQVRAVWRRFRQGATP